MLKLAMFASLHHHLMYAEGKFKYSYNLVGVLQVYSIIQ